MFLISTKIDKSNIHGLGLFTTQHLEPGQVVATWDDNFDRVFEHDVFDRLPLVAQQYIMKHGARTSDGRYKLGLDGDQYINHCDKPNLRKVGDSLVTIEKIPEATELTCDYQHVNASGDVSCASDQMT
jgi:hypothetical protein